ncbi:hypothetical protein [Terriglobus aquaticus]|uniref:Uncharacterized protein n=2 Tax=Terriglobus aquaticus TaxID=940139 RepID=A0ABW9KIP5_9BACT
MAARTVYEAVDAATAASPQNAPSRPAGGSARPVTRPVSPAPAVARTVRAAGRVQGSARAARSGVLTPVKRASRAVSLEIAGSFFGLFALSFAVAAWRFHASAGGQRLWVYVAFAAMFTYFACSSFVRARRLTPR